jgi:hypothetical protein
MQHSNAHGQLDLGPDAETAFGGLSGRLTVNLLTDARGVAVKLDGGLDLATAPQLDRQLAHIEATNVSRVLIDLGGVTFMDRHGPSVDRSRPSLRRVRPSHARAAAGHTSGARRFELTGIDERLTFEDD